jgi:hypothetical protein
MKLRFIRAIAIPLLFAFSFEQAVFAIPIDAQLFHYAPYAQSEERARLNTFETQFDLFGNPSVMIARDENGSRTWCRFDSSIESPKIFLPFTAKDHSSARFSTT